jgi:2-dehydro-3-deoxygalactonokinase
MMKDFLSCDWGTSTLRLNLVDGHTGKVRCREISDEGIGRIYALWRIHGGAESVRIAFYLNVLQQYINSIELKLSRSLAGCRLIISGMASSSIGLMELPYSELPVSLSGGGLHMVRLPASADFRHEITLISGVKSNDDVMRGEETQMIGCVTSGSARIDNQLFIFPGTHAKHLFIDNNKITSFKTYMTGDLFEMLSEKSILASSVERNDEIERPAHLKSFKKGVADAVDSNLLNTIFAVRTNNLLNVFTKRQNFHYLSGLLIGTELKDLRSLPFSRIHLLCGPELEKYYHIAFTKLGLAGKLQTYLQAWATDAAVRAHYKIYQQSSSYGK